MNVMEYSNETFKVVQEVVELFSFLDSSYRQSKVRTAVAFLMLFRYFLFVFIISY